MKKSKTCIFKCSSCGHEEPKWLGRCPECGEWNTLIETSISGALSGALRTSARRGSATKTEQGIPRSLPLSAIDPQEGNRVSSGIGELDRVLGGGIMKRSAILVGGEPGIGKSTLLLQAAAAAETTGRILYISGEESAGQVRMRADRLGLLAGPEDNRSKQAGQAERIEIVCSARLEDISAILDAVKPVIIIVDSVQTLFSPEIGLVPGTVNQMKYCSFELISWVKEHDAALFLVAHVTKDGIIAGPKTLEHMVDTVLYFEQNDQASGGSLDSRFLRASKNRFGSVDELGIFTMGEKGLKEVKDPSTLFLIQREGELPPGVAAAAVLEGSRCFLVEIQALTVPAKGSLSRVYSDRIDSGRVSRVAATLEKHLKLRLQDHDLYINVAGGIRINEVGVELALAGAIYSARTGLALPSQTALAGELSLAGEVRPVRRLNTRIKTSRSLGFGRFFGPGADSGETEAALADSDGIHRITSVKNAITLLFTQ
ncbi:MAG: DNA repair protein RadA [Spirochaetaceae bacterium]|jgi:DNA repair protein RadA/Sms|nr:DNA repair protein RadA [Spirochaetaceae bacterium]